MATFKAEVYAHQKREDGTYNIKIRVTQNKRKKYLSTVWYVTKDDLTRSLKLKNQKYIDLTNDLIRKYRDRCDRVGERLKSMTVEQVVELITSSDGEKFELDIVAYTWKEIERMKASGHSGNAYSYVTAIRSLVKFVGREQVMISEITVKFLQDWANWIAKQPKVTRGYVQHNYLNRMRAIHNRAKREFNDEDAGIIRIPNSPFSHIDFPKLPATRKRALTAEQIQAISKLDYTMIMQPGTNRFNFAKDLFMLSFCLIGMNGIDLYNCTDCKNGRLTYQRTKTRERRIDKAEISIKIEPEVQALIDKYRDPSGERVFKFYKLYSSMDTFTAAINKGLKRIGELVGIDDLEFYAARHSWATIALNDAGVDKYTVHTALNHVDDSMRVTDIYIRKSWEPIDQANRKVLDLLNLSLNNVNEPYNLPKQKSVLPKQNFETD
ncbi:MAG: site-specific integrase [Lachnospiraceae bacterium]|nr:site-specific integrase [Lachnospiraceae bacterium]